MRAGKFSVGKIIVIVVTCIWIPMNLLLFGVYVQLFGSMKSMVTDNQIGALSVYVKQLEARLGMVENYALSLLSDDAYAGIRNVRGSKNYELTKTEMQLRMSRLDDSGLWDNVDGNYVYIKHTQDVLESRNASVIDTDTNREIVDLMRSGETMLWCVKTIRGEDFVCAVWGNGIYNIGVFVRTDTLYSFWGENPWEIRILPSDEAKVPGDYIVFKQYPEGMDLTVSCRMPVKVFNSSFPMIYTFMFISLIASAVVIGALIFIFQKKIVGPLVDMEQTIRLIQGGDGKARMESGSLVLELDAICLAFNEMMDQIYEMKIQAYELKLDHEKTKLMNLQLQINPDLLLNALNTIYGLAEIREYENIQKFTENLVSYFRYALKNTSIPVRLRQELDFVKSYVEIQKIRYPDSFYVLYDVEDELMDLPVLPLIIENFVENSTKYAAERGHMTEILVIVRKRNDYLNISICDDGKGIEADVLQVLRSGQPLEKNDEVHVGIWNCERRLKLFYGEKAQFSITSVPGEGTQVWMEFPWREAGDDTFNC